MGLTVNWRLRRKARKGIWDHRFLNGHADVNGATRRFIMRAVAAGLEVTSTTDGVHAATSYHYGGRAADVGGRTRFGRLRMRKMRRFQRQEFQRRGRYLELFGPVNDHCVKNGTPLTLAEHSALEDLHDNHVHGACSR